MAAKTKTATAKKAGSSDRGPTKSELLVSIAEETGLSKKQVSSVFEALSGQIQKSMGGRGPGKFVVPGLMKMKVVKKPATKARKGINPFTGQETTFKAKPARKVVKIQALKALKDML
ncbi:nucleoid DNA-binding protein [Archangium gephyra]|uniref:Viral histone-like protein n=1 Tax=Archangium gephyra TaxID=48 RepID=A0AAC8QA74_9BACT|nr:HU family DNA-binding protein [Archangium gephyra]AKJ03888.1 DNA-binding protein HU, putative [Archangium gephyra]REG23667.1 nucleoid DNA-binding protein [Archangium gephyra]